MIRQGHRIPGFVQVNRGNRVPPAVHSVDPARLFRGQSFGPCAVSRALRLVNVPESCRDPCPFHVRRFLDLVWIFIGAKRESWCHRLPNPDVPCRGHPQPPGNLYNARVYCSNTQPTFSFFLPLLLLARPSRHHGQLPLRSDFRAAPELPGSRISTCSWLLQPD